MTANEAASTKNQMAFHNIRIHYIEPQFLMGRNGEWPFPGRSLPRLRQRVEAGSGLVPMATYSTFPPTLTFGGAAVRMTGTFTGRRAIFTISRLAGSSKR